MSAKTKFVGLLVLAFYMQQCAYVSANSKSLFLNKYSVVEFNRNELNHKHNRVRRSIDPHVYFSFEIDERKFDIKLSPQSVNDNDQILEIDNRREPMSKYTIYEGILLDEPSNSKVHGAIIDGLFVGSIHSEKSGTYHVEPAVRYDSSLGHSKTIVYHERDVETDLNKLKEKKAKIDRGLSCASAKSDVSEQIEQTQRNAKVRDINENKENHSRKKRQSTTSPYNGLDTCNMYLKVDPILYNTIYSNEGNKSDTSTTSYLLLYVQQQMAALNSIYSSIAVYTITPNPIYFQYLKFRQMKVKIYTSAVCSSGLSTSEAAICKDNQDEVTFLNSVSLDNYTSYCLSFTFTARDFADGTYGLAYLATTNGNAGGACQSQVTINGQTQSLNSGMVTLVSFAQRIPQVVNQITFAHEVGHTLGSTHDNSTSCVPGDSSGGNYIMYARATTGVLANNRRFSTCSITLMTSFLTYLVGSSRNCLKAYVTSTCGNGVIDTGEDCDTGDAAGNTCCKNCKLQTSSTCQCDPSQGLCCNSNFKYKASGTVCLAKSSCVKDITCSGTSAVCPTTLVTSFESDGTFCNSNRQTCINGSCVGSFCKNQSLTQCYLTGDFSDASVNRSVLCYLACIYNGVCTPTSNISLFNNTIHQLQPGSPCNNNLGYCDNFARCRSFNAENQLLKLTQSLLAPETITWSDVKTWVQTYWWAILIFSVLFVLANILIVICIHRHTVSDNPEKSLHLNFKETMKSPMNVFRSLSNIHHNKRKEESISSRKSMIKRGDGVAQGPREIIPSLDYFQKYTSPRNSNFDIQTVSATAQAVSRNNSIRKPARRAAPKIIDD